MKTIPDVSTRIYPQLLGASWDDLGESLQQFHGAGETVRARGTFQVRHGNNPLARLLVRLARLPAATQAVDVCLVVSRGADIPVCHQSGRQECLPHEQWRREFPQQSMVSSQWRRPDGLLAERAGLLELSFRLEVASGAIIYHQQSAALRLGWLRLPLPRWCMPRVSAWEKPAGEGKHIQVSVTMNAPLFGLLLAYDGTITTIEVQ